MRFVIKHEIRGRLRIHLCRQPLTIHQADVLEQHLSALPGIQKVRIYDRTADVVILYTGEREQLTGTLQRLSLARLEKSVQVPADSGRQLNRDYKEKLVQRLLARAAQKVLFPAPLRAACTLCRAAGYLVKGLRCLAKGQLQVEVLDATAISVSLLRRDFDTAGSIMFLLGIGELLEEWTHKKSVGDLARSMSLNINKVWLNVDGARVLTAASRIVPGDQITVHMGNVIPFDGEVISGEAMVNQAALTGESMPVKKEAGSSVYAGTAVEEGEITFRVKSAAGDTRFERIVTMIEDSEKLKSTAEGQAANLADALVPWSLAGTALTWLLTRNANRAISILMVDFSCALKLAMPLAVLSAMREAGNHHITVKGGKYLEAVAEAETIVFDKTGTLTKACPVVAEVVAFGGQDPDEMLRLAACLEEHFPHSMAKAVVDEAVRRKLDHEEMHSKVDYIVAHGIASYVKDSSGEGAGEKATRVIIGSYHFVFEDEGCKIPDGDERLFEQLKPEYSHLYLAIGGILAAVICIQDPIRPEAAQVIRKLKELGIKKTVMMTGDSERTARAVARQIGVDEYDSEVLPEDKAGFVEEEKRRGRKVIMIGDGINDSPALSASDAGIAISEGAAIAREIADITISENDLYQLIVLRTISSRLMARIQQNYRQVIGFNLGLILLGAFGVLQPAVSALLHNTSTLVISLKSMTNLLEEGEEA